MSGGMLVDQFTTIFNQAFSYTSTATTLPGAYYTEVGTYTAVGMPILEMEPSITVHLTPITT